MKAARILMFAPLFLGTAALAQEAPPPAAAPQAPAEAAAPVSEEEVDRFALAALVVEQIARDEALDQEQKQSAMVDAVAQTGLEPQRFNEIATASRTDTELQERIQVAAAAHVQAAQQNQ
jgi:hypothetical protein